MLVTMDLDLTPETAESLYKFRSLFTTYGFLTLALGSSGIGETDLSSLYRVLSGVLTQASGAQLCPAPEPVTVQSAQDSIAQCAEILARLREEALTWFLLQSPEVQKAVLELLNALYSVILSKYQELPPEQQNFWKALLNLIRTIKGEMV